VDKHERIHLICITLEEELRHYTGGDNNWNYRVVSKLDIKSNIYKYLTLHINSEYIHLLYVKTSLLTQTLSTIEHMYWNGKNVNRIVVSNYIHGKYSSPLQVSFDGSQNFHIIYRAFYKNNHQLYYNKFDILTKIWTISELVTDLREEHSHPYIFIDKKQNLHLLWCTIEQNNFILKYKKKRNIIDTKSRWSDTQTLSNKISNYLFPVLIQESNTLKIYCRQNDKITELISNDFGDSWTDLADDRSYVIEEPKIIRYLDNPQINSNYVAKYVYGNIKDTIQIIGVDLFDSRGRNDPTPTQSILNQTRNSEASVDKIERQFGKPLADISTQEVNYTTCEIEQNNNIIIDLDKLNNTADNTKGPGGLMNELLSDYNTLEKQLFGIKEKKQKLIESIGDYEIDLDLLEEKIMNYKKQILAFQEKPGNVASNDSVLQRLIRFFK
jgi:hypothetical protein